ncbi:Probable conserved membrane protein, MmpL family [Mycobacteroides abscessus subsp. abscessus]|nr:Probable conserved membrane protein, MmpL family [Mycobacteroides abscessus subsp. abscessus]
MMLERLARSVIAAPRLVLGMALLIAIAAALFGVPVTKHLAAGGQQDPNSESAYVTKALRDKFDISDQSLVFMLTSEQGVKSPQMRAVAADLERQLKDSGVVINLTSAWTAPPQVAEELLGADGKAGLIVAGLTGGENDAQKHAAKLIKSLAVDRDGVAVKAGGVATLYNQIVTQSEKDLLVMESIAIPISFVVLVWIFGGLYAALLPLVVGVFSIVGAMSILRGLTYVTDVSVFALNLAVAMGLALAIDYSLLIISRYREEVNAGKPRDEALVLTMTSPASPCHVDISTIACTLSAACWLASPRLDAASASALICGGHSCSSASVIPIRVPLNLAFRSRALDQVAIGLIARHELLGRRDVTIAVTGEFGVVLGGFLLPVGDAAAQRTRRACRSEAGLRVLHRPVRSIMLLLEIVCVSMQLPAVVLQFSGVNVERIARRPRNARHGWLSLIDTNPYVNIRRGRG